MEAPTKTTIFLIALALASSADAFVPQSSTMRTVNSNSDTKLNALWRNWIPQTTDMMDLMVGQRQENERREFVIVGKSLDENDVATSTSTSTAARKRERTVSLVSDASSANANSNASDFGFWATTTAAALLVAFAAVPSSFAVSGGGLDYAGLDISNQDFSKGNYKGKDFTQVLARNTNFAGSNLAGCRFPKAYLINANYEGADIRGVSFEGTNLESVNLKSAIASGAYFGETVLEVSSIENADFTDAQFPPKTLAQMCERPDMKGTNPTTGVDTRDSAMCP